MLLAREFVAYLSRELVKKLTPAIIETSQPETVSELYRASSPKSLLVEDRLNEEVRDILGQYSDYMRREGVSYQEMFRRIKNTLITQRKVIRAAGRDTGDHMKLSRDKINDMSHKIVSALRRIARATRQERSPTRCVWRSCGPSRTCCFWKIRWTAARVEDPIAEKRDP